MIAVTDGSHMTLVIHKENERCSFRARHGHYGMMEAIGKSLQFQLTGAYCLQDDL